MSSWILVAKILETGPLSFEMSSSIVGMITVTSLPEYNGFSGTGIDL